MKLTSTKIAWAVIAMGSAFIFYACFTKLGAEPEYETCSQNNSTIIFRT